MCQDVRVVAAGGTIASTAVEGGAKPQKSGREVIEAVPELTEVANVSVTDVASVPGFDVDQETIVRMGKAVREAERDGADGAVVTHGTDTMEESAYWLDLALGVDIPVVFTGAQRRSDEVGFDGYANLLTAARTVTDERFRAAGGVYLAFDDEVHAARDVTKTHTSKLGTFDSPGKGPVASATREGLRIYREPGSRSVDLPHLETDARVTQVKTGVGVDSDVVDAALDAGVDGLVVEGTGLGNVTSDLGDAVGRATDASVPVVVTSRCHAGSVAPVYGTPGGGVVLVAYGAISGDDLPTQKARVKLMLALAATDDPDELRAYFERPGTAEP